MSLNLIDELQHSALRIPYLPIYNIEFNSSGKGVKDTESDDYDEDSETIVD